MASCVTILGSRGGRHRRKTLPCVWPLEDRVVPALVFPGIAGITFGASGIFYVSYNSTGNSSIPQESVAELDLVQNNQGISSTLLNPSVFSTSGASALPGALTAVGSTASLPGITANEILELEPDGQLLGYNPSTDVESPFDNLSDYTAVAAHVFDVQTGKSTDLSDTISLAGATYGDFDVFENSLVVAAESNGWDFVLRVSYGSSGGVATVLAASPIGPGLADAPQGVGVDSTGMVLATLPYIPAGSTTAIDAPVGFNLFYDNGSSPAPFITNLGLTSVPDIDSGGITVDSSDNFLVGATNTSLFGGGPGVVHINAALSAFLAVPNGDPESIVSGITYQSDGGTNFLAFIDSNPDSFADSGSDTFTIRTELSLFSNQVTPAQLRHAYGIDQIGFTGAGGTSVTADGSGQTIAIVEENIDPTIGADLNTFDQFFGIPAPPSFKVVEQSGAELDVDTVGEASLDVEWAHAIAPGASIVVYDTALSFDSVIEAMQQASELPGVSVVTLSYAGAETGLDQAFEQSFDSDFTTPGVTFLAASGDSGIFGNGGDIVSANYPAASPNVVAVGGTSIVIDSAGDYPGTGAGGETAWGEGAASGEDGGGGGGLSAFEPEPSWQRGVVPSSIDPPSINTCASSSRCFDGLRARRGNTTSSQVR